MTAIGSGGEALRAARARAPEQIYMPKAIRGRRGIVRAGARPCLSSCVLASRTTRESGSTQIFELACAHIGTIRRWQSHVMTGARDSHLFVVRAGPWSRPRAHRPAARRVQHPRERCAQTRALACVRRRPARVRAWVCVRCPELRQAAWRPDGCPAGAGVAGLGARRVSLPVEARAVGL
jgi:hypothetical protein